MEPNYIQETLNPDQNDKDNLFQHLSITNSDDHVVDDSDSEEEFSFMSVGAAEDAFMDGKIKPVFPLFNMELKEDYQLHPHVHKVFIEMGSDEISGPYCDLSNRKVVQVDSEDGCKKSNSTGFSKIWRFKDLVGRSNSDGKDAFVFLDKETVNVVVSEKMKKATKSSSSHEVYLKRRAKDQERRQPSLYLPYRLGFFTTVNGGLTRNVHPY